MFLLWRRTRDARKRQMWFLRCGSSHSARMSAHRGPSESLKLWKKRGIGLSVHYHDSSHHELVHEPSHWSDDEEDGCACCSSCMGFSFVFLFLLAFSDTLYCQMILGVLHYQQIDVRALLNVQPSPMYLFTKRTWLLVFCMVTEFLCHANVPNLTFSRFMYASSFDQRSTHPSKKSSVLWWDRRLLCAS